MKKILVTGGTVFVSRFIAKYYAQKGYEVYVLNRNHYPQPENTILIEADRHNLGNVLNEYCFDAVLDVTAYTAEDVSYLLNALKNFKDYVFISSSAVYPESLKQPFNELQPAGNNQYWGTYGTNKMKAEKELQNRVPNAYIFRPPYLYGPMNNIYREAFVFDCAEQNRTFYLPKDGKMQLQFFHVQDLCRCIDAVLDTHPSSHIFNVGNAQCISIKDWVTLCYQVTGHTADFIEIHKNINQRKYFCFSDYEYELDVSRQKELITDTLSLEQGLKEAWDWYQKNKNMVNRKDYIAYIDKNLTNSLLQAF